MPRKYDNKSAHNKAFLTSIQSDYPEDYYDWKVTVQFYTGLHRCYCVLEVKSIPIETSHSSNIKNLKPINTDLSQNLYKLYKFSRQSRYDGFMSDEAMLRINKINFKEGNGLLKQIESEVLNYYPVVEAV